MDTEESNMENKYTTNYIKEAGKAALEGLEKELYFTPNIEDIRVGYECEYATTEISWNSCRIEAWHLPFVIKDISRVKVPYLTKEQIEGEGWIFIVKNIYEKKVKINDLDNLIFTLRIDKQNLNITETKDINLRKEEVPLAWRMSTSPIYVGECKDINTFRYICKLLNI